MKKACATLLICCLAILAMRPAAAQITSVIRAGGAQAHSCCKAPSQRELPADDCCGKGFCNPFAACACCPGYILAMPLSLKASHIIALAKDYPLLRPQDLASRYLSECWHPPKIV